MRKFAIIIALLIGLLIGYLVGCRSHGQGRTVTHEPAPGQRWVDRDGHHRIVRTMTRDGERVTVWWHHDLSTGRDRHCTIGTWRNWARAKGAVPE